MKTKSYSIIFLIFSTLSVMAQKNLETEIIIQASPEIVWEVLTNFEDYPNWNPFIKSLEGDMTVGNNIKIKLPDMSFKPKLLVFDENKELRWIGKLFFKGLFDGEHSFEIIDNHDGTVTFKHNEKFNGILVNLFSKKLDTETRTGFEDMNKALKKRVEELIVLN